MIGKKITISSVVYLTLNKQYNKGSQLDIKCNTLKTFKLHFSKLKNI